MIDKDSIQDPIEQLKKENERLREENGRMKFELNEVKSAIVDAVITLGKVGLEVKKIKVTKESTDGNINSSGHN